MPTLKESAFFGVDIKICTIFAVREPAKPLNNAKIGGSFFFLPPVPRFDTTPPYFCSSNAQISSRIASICRDARLVRPKTQLNKIITTGGPNHVFSNHYFHRTSNRSFKIPHRRKKQSFFWVMFYRR